jgi:hypothetical protein
MRAKEYRKVGLVHEGIKFVDADARQQKQQPRR